MHTFFLKTLLTSFGIVALTFSAGKLAHAVEFQVQKPAGISIPREITRVFIYPKLFKSRNDRLRMKSRILLYLKKEINALGRFKVTLGAPKGYDPNRETVAIISGEVISGLKMDNGQFTDKADCSASSAAMADDEDKLLGVTKSRRGLTCIRTDSYSETPAINYSGEGTASVLGAVFKQLTGVDVGKIKVPDIQQPVDQVIRTYRYTNHSLFTQVQFNVTLQGLSRETLLVQTESASFNRQVIDTKSFRNVRESADQFSGAVWPLLLVSPVVSIDHFRIGVIADTIPDIKSRYYNRAIPLDRKERVKVIKQLVQKIIQPFIRSVSPYKVTIDTEIASGTESMVKLLNQKKFQQAREALVQLNDPGHADLYNTGLVFEATASNRGDLEEAKRYYIKAIQKEPATELYAQGIGRIEFQLKSYKKLEAQTQ